MLLQPGARVLFMPRCRHNPEDWFYTVGHIIDKADQDGIWLFSPAEDARIGPVCALWDAKGERWVHPAILHDTEPSCC